MQRADFITLHTPLTEKTRNIINADIAELTKKSVRLINCARGGLVDEAALLRRPRLGPRRRRGARCFRQRTSDGVPLFALPNVVCTPHLGASTTEAQENVALQVAEQMSDYLMRGAITNAVNFPSISAEEAPKLKPFVALAEKLGSFAGQLTETGIERVQVSYEGFVAQMNTRALTSAAIAGMLRPMLQDVNVVSAPIVAKDRGIVVEETRRETEGDYESLITVAVVTDRQTRWVSGTVYADGRPRIVNIKGIRIDAEFGPSMLYVTNQDRPGFVGRFATLLAGAGINIATFHLGREAAGGDAIALVEVDGAVAPEVLAKVQQIPNVQQVKAAAFLVHWLLPRRYGNADEYQRITDRVINLEALAEQDDRHHRAEDGHEMHEWRGAVRADQIDAAVETKIAKQRRKHAHISDAGQADGVEHNGRRACEFPDQRRQEQHRPPTHADGEERQRMHRRPLA